MLQVFKSGFCHLISLNLSFFLLECSQGDQYGLATGSFFDGKHKSFEKDRGQKVDRNELQTMLA